MELDVCQICSAVISFILRIVLILLPASTTTLVELMPIVCIISLTVRNQMCWSKQ